ncbi:hypothetical protein [Anaerophilus nitritogenes]|uniref:hypothetical protein n=1 Tax=Anaerophilus nitritogenes TaxID=2498136 RepID=UPI00101E1E7A|nr:hypothetical protein [Anaerophilus nitritogenes]
MLKGLLKSISYYAVMGMLVVFGKRCLKYRFSIDIIRGDFPKDFVIGITVFVIMAIISELIKRKKAYQQ